MIREDNYLLDEEVIWVIYFFTVFVLQNAVVKKKVRKVLLSGLTVLSVVEVCAAALALLYPILLGSFNYVIN